MGKQLSEEEVIAKEYVDKLWYPPDPCVCIAPSIVEHNERVIQEAVERAMAKVCSMISKHNEQNN